MCKKLFEKKIFGKPLENFSHALEQHLVNGQPLDQTKLLKTREEMNFFVNLKADVGVVVAYGLILPLEFINSPTFGCINLHASLLPRWRGASPIQHAILANDQSYGFTLMQIELFFRRGPLFGSEKKNQFNNFYKAK